MAFRKAVKGTLIGGGAVAAAFGLSQFIEYRKNQVNIQTSSIIVASPLAILSYAFLLLADMFHIHTLTPTG